MLKEIKKLDEFRLAEGPQNELDRLKETLLEERRAIYGWIREYIVHADWSELKHQEGLKGGRDVNPILERGPSGEGQTGYDITAFVRLATPEEIRHYLRGAVGRFNTSGWDSRCGGPKWALIASAGLKMWEEGEWRFDLVDHVFDLRHNTGPIFDKHDALIRQGEHEKALLDLKGNQDVRGVLQEVRKLGR